MLTTGVRAVRSRPVGRDGTGGAHGAPGAGGARAPRQTVAARPARSSEPPATGAEDATSRRARPGPPLPLLLRLPIPLALDGGMSRVEPPKYAVRGASPAGAPAPHGPAAGADRVRVRRSRRGCGAVLRRVRSGARREGRPGPERDPSPTGLPAFRRTTTVPTPPNRADFTPISGSLGKGSAGRASTAVTELVTAPVTAPVAAPGAECAGGTGRCVRHDRGHPRQAGRRGARGGAHGGGGALRARTRRADGKAGSTGPAGAGKSQGRRAEGPRAGRRRREAQGRRRGESPAAARRWGGEEGRGR